MDDPEAQLRRIQIRKRLVIVGGVALVILSPCAFFGYGYYQQTRPGPDTRGATAAENEGPVGPASEEQRRAVEQALATFENSLDARVGPWRDAMASAGGARPAPELGRCPFTVPPPRSTVTSTAPSEGSVMGLTSAGASVHYVTERDRAFDYVLVEDGILPPEPAIITRLRGRAAPIRRRIEMPETPEAHARTVERAERLVGLTPRWDVVVFVSSIRRPRMSEHLFNGGEIVATVVLYDHRAESVACAVEVTARPDDVQAVGFRDSQRATFELALHLALDDALEREISRHMRFRAYLPPSPADEPL